MKNVFIGFLEFYIKKIFGSKDDGDKIEWSDRPQFTIQTHEGGYFTIKTKGTYESWGYYWITHLGENRALEDKQGKPHRFDTKLAAKSAIDEHYKFLKSELVIEFEEYDPSFKTKKKRGSEILDLLDENVTGEKEKQLIKELKGIY